MDRAQLEQLVAQKMAETETAPASSFDRKSLEEAVAQKMSEQGVAPIDKSSEADLGFVNRAKYSIEPIQSNRKALLSQEYGDDNVMEDKSGNLYVKQDGSFHPVNKEGFSVADVADIAGATPEIAGGIVGAGVGAIAGVPTGGTMSVPMAMATGAAGAGAGSMIRQGLSAAIGNPQVATIGERALETGTSAAIGGVTSGAAQAVKPYAQKAKQGITQWLKGLGKEATETTGSTLANSETKTLAKTGINLEGEIKPVGIPETEKEVMGEIADRSANESVIADKAKLSQIATKEGLPEPSYAMAAQGKAILAENKILDMPFVGHNARKVADKQTKVLKNNLEKITGRVIDAESDNRAVGQAAKEYADTMVEGKKKIAQELYDKVETDGANAMIGKKTLFNKYRDYAGELGLINPDGTKAVYDATSGLTEATHNKLQNTLFQAMDAMGRNQSPKIRFQDANGLRKTLKATVEELKNSDPNGHRLLSKFGKELDDTMEHILNREAPSLGGTFRAANQNWRTYKQHQEIVDKMIGNLDDERVVSRVMNSTQKISDLKEIIGDDHVKEIAKSYVADLLYKLNKSGIGRADSVIDSVRKNAPHLEDALGKDTYDKLMNNLYYLNRTGRPLTNSRTSLYNLFDNRGAGLKGAVINIKGVADTVAESKGTTVGRAAYETVAKPVGKVFETTGRVVEKSSGGQKLSGFANLMGDEPQRNVSAMGSGKQRLISDNESEQEKRKRIISGKKGN
jgi:uncharacterized protein YbjQ (UPF0145 family)